MSTKTRNFFIGFGSILDIMPNRERCTPSRPMPMTPEQINAKAWDMVGDSFRMAMGQVHDELRPKRSKN
ncbi:MAG: hypothetical protein PHI97_23455 [Desulfobulbus sp.]|nr:hypothetical protein [Desulfobulbus sp.]